MNSPAAYLPAFRDRIATIAMASWLGAGMLVAATMPIQARAGAHSGRIIQAQERPLRAPDDQALVTCMLPGQIRRLNNQMMIMGARRPILATRADCRVRGGEYRPVEPRPRPARSRHPG